MTIKNFNHPLIRELQELGILTAGSSPQLSGPFKVNTEAFVGDTSGATKTLAQTPINVFACVTIPTDGTSDNTLTSLVEDTHFSLSSATLTWLADYSARQILLMYSY